jgi:hypothetical protein
MEQLSQIGTRVVMQWESWEFNATKAIKATLWLVEIFECRTFDGGVIIVGYRRRCNDPDGIQAIMENLIQCARALEAHNQVRYTTYGGLKTVVSSSTYTICPQAQQC